MIRRLHHFIGSLTRTEYVIYLAVMGSFAMGCALVAGNHIFHHFS